MSERTGTSMNSLAELETLHAQIRACMLCPLSMGRTHAVPGEGPINPTIMLIGEAPGKNEDLQGRPFVGAAGKILSGLLEKALVKREDVFITSVCKCRPPENRVPTQVEAKTCKTNYLQKQIQILKPRVIGLMGRTAIAHVLEEEVDLEAMHGKTMIKDGQTYLILYHPAAMIYNQSLKPRMEADFASLGKHASS